MRRRSSAEGSVSLGRASMCVSLCLTPQAEILHQQPSPLDLHTVGTASGEPCVVGGALGNGWALNGRCVR